MRNGIPEREDGQALLDIYHKIKADGTLREPLGTEEMVLIFALGRWLKKAFGGRL